MDCLIGFCHRARGKKNPYVIMPFGCLSGPGPTASEAPLALARGPLATPWVPEHAPGLPGPCRRRDAAAERRPRPWARSKGTFELLPTRGRPRVVWSRGVDGACGRRWAANGCGVGGWDGWGGWATRRALSGARAARMCAPKDGQGRPEQRCSVMEAPTITRAIERPCRPAPKGSGVAHRQLRAHSRWRTCDMPATRRAQG